MRKTAAKWTAIVVVLPIVLYGLWQFHKWYTSVPPSVAWSLRIEQCFIVAIVDDSGADIDAQPFVARTLYNQAMRRGGQSPNALDKVCSVYENFWTTRPPSEGDKPGKSLRQVDTLDWWQYLLRGSRQKVAAALVERIKAKDPTVWDEEKFPGLKCMEWYVRAPRWFPAWEDAQKMEAETYPVFKTPMGTEFRCLNP